MKISAIAFLLLFGAGALCPAAALDAADLLQRAAQFERNGDYQKAIRLLLDGRKTLGEPSLFAWELSRLYLQQTDYPRAVDALLLLVRQSPQRYPVVEQHLLGLMGDETAASAIGRALEEALARESDVDGSGRQIAQLASACALERGDAEGGLRLLAGLDDTPENGDLLFQYASRCQARNRQETAASAYALFAARRPDSAYLYQALLRRAQIAVQNDDHARAAELYGRLIRRYPDRPEAQEALVHLGRLQLEELNDLEAARASLETALKSPHRHQLAGQTLELLAEIALREEDLPRAEKYLNQLQRRYPQSAYPARLRRAELHFLRTDFNAAQQILEDLLAEDPAHPLANDAIDLLLLCDQLQDQDPALEHFIRAQLLERQRRVEEAAREWDWLAANAAPTVRELSLLSRARTRLQRGAADAALALYEELAALNPDGPHAVEAHLQIGRLREAREEFKTALKLYETALLSAPDDARIPEVRLRIQRLRRQLSEESK